MKWFKEVFLPSFELYNGKQITEKQAQIFIKYLKDYKESDNTTYYSGNIDGKSIILQESSVYNGCYYNSKGRHTNYRKEYYITIKQ